MALPWAWRWELQKGMQVPAAVRCAGKREKEQCQLKHHRETSHPVRVLRLVEN